MLHHDQQYIVYSRYTLRPDIEYRFIYYTSNLEKFCRTSLLLVIMAADAQAECMTIFTVSSTMLTLYGTL
jgi:hypothetical protein